MRTLAACGFAIAWLALAAPAARASEPMDGPATGRLTVFAGLGLGRSFNGGAPSGGIDVNFGVVHQRPESQFGLGGEASYIALGSRDASIQNDLGQTIEVKATLSTIPVTGQAYYIFPTSGSAGGYFDAGAGLYSTRAKTEAKESGSAGSFEGSGTVTNTDFGINLGGGLKFGKPDSSIRFGVDGKFHVIMTSNQSTKVGTAVFRVYFH